MQCIDLNCDLGEGAGQDAALMPLITSANIACGAHAGDRDTMRATVALAQQCGVSVGAHPGFADRGHFGRRELSMPADEIRALVTEQVAALRTFGMVRHVKPHGGLYNLAGRDRSVAEAVAEAIFEVDASLILFAPANSELALAGGARGLRVAKEVFADRTYQRDGSLTPRSHPDAFVNEENAAMAQVLRMIRDGVVRAQDGTDVPIMADTVCVHGDGPNAVSFAWRLNVELRKAGIEIRAFRG
jgi:5-oxoprolinase (ATP-hydrolysing) subunit A